MSINLNDNLIVQAPKATDERYGPYASEAEALTAIEPIVRYRGLTAGVIIDGVLKEYWFNNGISDTDFSVKTTGITKSIGDIEFACSDEDSNLSAGLKFTFIMPYYLIIDRVRLSLNTAPVGDYLIVDVKSQGVSIFSVKPSVVNNYIGGHNAVLTSSPYTLPENSVITVYIDQVGSSVPGAGLKVWLLGEKGGPPPD